MSNLSDIPSIVVVNESSVLNTNQAWNIAWALNYWVRWQMGPLWKVGAQVSLLPSGVQVPSGSWILHLLDFIDQIGALGYHDENDKQVPYGRVGVRTSQEAGVSASEVACHEIGELLVDPHVNMSAFDPKAGRLYATEIGDPAQGGAYDLGAPYGKTTGIVMSNFVKPEWFDPMTPATAITDYRGMCTGPFGLGKGGYVSYTTSLPPSWQQEMGEDATPALVDADTRVARRRLAAA